MRATEREERAAAANRPVALITGVGRVAGLAAAIAILARDGWDIASTAWAPDDERMPWGRQDGDSQLIDAVLLRAGARTIAVPADLADITANVINPGPIDTGWMTAEQVREVARATPRGRAGQPSDTAALVSFLCSADGGWINGQLLTSDGGPHA